MDLFEYNKADVEFTFELVKSMRKPWYKRLWNWILNLINPKRQFKLYTTAQIDAEIQKSIESKFKPQFEFPKYKGLELKDIERICSVLAEHIPPRPDVNWMKVELCAKLLQFDVNDADSIRNSGIVSIVKIYQDFFGFAKGDGYVYGWTGKRYRSTPLGGIDLFTGEYFNIPKEIDLETEIRIINSEEWNQRYNRLSPLPYIPII